MTTFINDKRTFTYIVSAHKNITEYHIRAKFDFTLKSPKKNI